MENSIWQQLISADRSDGPADSSIANEAQECASSFRSLLLLFSKETLSPVAADTRTFDNDTNDYTSKAVDQFERYKVWCANVGADDRGQDSLEYRLRDKSNIVEQIKMLFLDLTESISTCFAIETGSKSPWDQAIDENNESDAGEQEDFPFNTELQQAFADISDIIDCLNRLSQAIKVSVPHDEIMLTPRLGTPKDNPWDVQHIRTNTKVSEEIANKLGKANAQRRAYFRYRKVKYDETQTNRTMGENETQISTDAPVSTRALLIAALLGKYGKAHNPGEQPRDNSDLQELSTADSSGTSIAKSPPPTICPFCWTTVYLKGNTEWKKHIFSDLRPYICVEPDCTDFESLYETHNEWIRHVRYSHWMRWECAAGCTMCFSQEEDLTHHLKTCHTDLTKDHLDALIALSARPGSGFRELECPFCLKRLTTETQYQEHVGWHQELLASSCALPTRSSLALPPRRNPQDTTSADTMINPRSTTDSELQQRVTQQSPHESRGQHTHRPWANIGAYCHPQGQVAVAMASSGETDESGGFVINHTSGHAHATSTLDVAYSSQTSSSTRRSRELGGGGGLRWICPACDFGLNNSWDIDSSCPFCHGPRPVAPCTFYG